MIGCICVIGVIVVLDVLSKYWVVSSCTPECVVTSIISFHPIINRGIALSFLHSESAGLFWVLFFMILSVTLVLAFYTYHRWLEYKPIVGESLILAGASANLLDRLIHAGVVDFIAVTIKGYTFPLFNSADAAIMWGVGILVVRMLRGRE